MWCDQLILKQQLYSIQYHIHTTHVDEHYADIQNVLIFKTNRLLEKKEAKAIEFYL
jgi:hypothetical protein